MRRVIRICNNIPKLAKPPKIIERLFPETQLVVYLKRSMKFRGKSLRKRVKSQRKIQRRTLLEVSCLWARNPSSHQNLNVKITVLQTQHWNLQKWWTGVGFLSLKWSSQNPLIHFRLKTLSKKLEPTKLFKQVR